MANQFDDQFLDEILNLMNDDVSPSINNNNNNNNIIDHDHNHNLQQPSSSNHNEDQNVILQNFRNLLFGPYDHNGGENFEVGPSQIHDGEEGHNLGSDPNFDDNIDSMPLCSWPLPPVPFNCSCCQVLREIIHVKDNALFKLEIHGRLGLICHAVLEKRNVIVHPSILMHDFCHKSIEEVKQFLLQYCIERKFEGYVMLPDPLATFYETICVGLDWDSIMNNNGNLLLSSPPNSGELENQIEQVSQQEVQNEEQRSHTYSLSEQRRRTRTFTMNQLKMYLTRPIEEACGELNLCQTVVKKICRQNGLKRWPYRKIKSTKRQIDNLTPSLASSDANIRKQAQVEIDRLREDLKNKHCGGIDVLLPPNYVSSNSQ